jgi:hypothetical protein
VQIHCDAAVDSMLICRGFIANLISFPCGYDKDVVTIRFGYDLT